MPPKTKAQARALWARKPEMMKRWKRKGKHKPTGGRKKKR
jgi:hypothetical protein